MNSSKTTNQNIRQIPLSAMEPESGYQRPTCSAKVKRIVRNFDETKLGILIVSARDGKYHLVDGSHRSKALRQLGYTHALCVVLNGLTFEQEAEYFRNQGKDRSLIKPMDYYKAGLASGNKQCVRISKIVRSNGFYIRTNSKDFYKIAAIQALLTITNEYGYDTLDETLCLLASTWNGISKASHSECLLGIAEFVSRYGMCDFAERMKDKFSAVLYDYTEAVRVRTSAPSAISRKKLCRILVEHYNKGLGSNSRKRLSWEG